MTVDDQNYLNKLLNSWEDVFKKGQLSLWILLSLKDSPKYVDEIKSFIEEITNGHITAEEQSLYRSLRKFHDLEVVNYESREGNKGPDRKYYFLTDLGKKLLDEFIERNIKVFYKENILDLINK